MTQFITLTAAEDKTPIRLKVTTINGIYTSDTRRTIHFADNNTSPGRTIVSAAAGTFTVTETQEDVMNLITEAGAP